MAHPNFKEFVTDRWNGYQVTVWASYIFGNLDLSIENKKGEIEALDRIDDTFGLEVNEIIDRKRVSAELLRDLQVAEGDLNSSFFHGWLNRRFKANGIKGLLVNGAWVDSVGGIKMATFNHFRHHFQSNGGVSVDMT
ncbi:hypothetical protein ACS0TY_030560 [Phlomoides rotata]